MAILTGTSSSRFPAYDDPNTGIGVLIQKGQNAVLDFLTQVSAKETWENQYVETGATNIPGFSTIESSYAHIKKPAKRKIYSQHPKATILIKKRMFSTLRSNYDVRFMNEKEKIFIRAAKIIFEKKCEEIAYHESLSNIKGLFNESGFLNIENFADGVLDSFLLVLEGSFAVLESFGANVQDGLESFASQALPDGPLASLQKFVKIINQLMNLREKDRRAKGSQFTRWIYDPFELDTTGLGLGVGVIELNQITNFSTDVALDGGGATLGIEDPYRMMIITESDIEQALRQAVSEKDISRSNNALFAANLLDTAKQLDNGLNSERRRREVSQINFEFDMNRDEVVATLIATGQQFTVSTINDISENESLEGNEYYYALQIFKYLDEYRTLSKRNLAQFQIINKDFNDVRQRLRNEFVGSSIIQQMDMVHVFMNSETRDDSTSNLQAQNITDLFTNYLNIQQDALDISTVKIEHEELAPDLPFALYAMLRDLSSFRSDGTQIFSGLVDSVSTSYEASTGVFKVDVSCKDNSEFLELSKINVDPSVAQVQGMLYDPLTPFDLKTDAGTGLVNSTPQFSTANKARMKYLRFPDGINAGEQVDEKNIFHDKQLGGKVLSFQHVPGLIYQWKNGIVTETLDINARKPLDGGGATLSDAIEVYGIVPQDNAFAGLDSADIVSILVTGRPHNYATFFKQALDAGTISVDATNQNKSYFNYLFDFLERQQNIKGNFIPSIPSPIDSGVAASVFREKRKLEGKNQQLLAKQKRLTELQVNLVSGTEDERTALQAEVTRLQNDIATALEAESLAQANTDPENKGKVSLGVIGNEFYVSFSDRDLDDFKRKLKYRLKKKPEDVRFNTDQNFLVVSDQYDSDTDIQAFARNLKSTAAELYNSTYESPGAICKKAADAIGFEFFADSQGNIVFRPPQYNRTPLSLLLKLIAVKRTEGVSYAPEFLTDLFRSRMSLIEDKVTLLDLQILEKLILMGTPANMAAPGGISVPGVSTLVLTIKKAGASSFVQDKQIIFDLANKDRIFGIESQNELLNSPVQFSLSSAATELINVRNSIFEITGLMHRKKNAADPNDRVLAEEEIKAQISSKEAQLNKLNLINDIAQLISERQILLRAYASLSSNSQNFSLNDGSSPVSELPVPSSVVAQLTGTLGDSPVFPKFMESLIENDLSNEDGWRSGKRFIIEDDIIISTKLATNTPEFNFIEVVGNQDYLQTNDGSFGGVPRALWAGSVDFDSWRRFGLKVSSQQIFRADFTSAESQCAPYAVFKLIEQRAKIHAGTITVMGNEFYQVGDVVYLNMNSMLYYVTGVSHSFDFNTGVFQTTLELKYGRALGEYIPTTLDVIGKGLISDARKSVGNIKAVRTSVPTNHAVHLDTFYFNAYNNLSSEEARTLEKGSYGESFISNLDNKNKAQSLVTMVNTQINKDKQGNSRIEVRTYYLSDPIDSDILKTRALAMGAWVKNLLLGAVGGDQTILDRVVVKQIQPIDMSPNVELSDRDKALMRYPSGQAWAGENPFTDQDGVGLPLNAIDIFFVTEKGKYGDLDPEDISDSDVVI